MFIYDLSIFLTSTAFVNTNTKYGIPPSRYTVFLKNCPLGRRPNASALFFVFLGIILIHVNILQHAFWSKFRKTKQKVVALVATALKALFTISQTNGRLSGCQLYAGNINYPFLNIFTHISPYLHIKKVRGRSRAPKNANSDCCYTKPDNWDIVPCG